MHKYFIIEFHTIEENYSILCSGNTIQEVMDYWNNEPFTIAYRRFFLSSTMEELQ